MSKKIIIFHPILFAIFPILYLYSNNSARFTYHVIIIPIIISVFITSSLWVLLSDVFKSKIKAALTLSVSILLFFSYTALYILIENVQISLVSITFEANDIIFLSYFSLLILSIYVSMKTRKKNLYSVTKFLNIISIIFIITAFPKIITNKVSKVNNIIPASIEVPKNSLIKGRSFPDIYYIILDGYARADVLKEIYRHDNADFIKYLTKKGFYVITNSRSNYSQTSLSLASSLNFDYINNLVNLINIESADRNPLINLIRNNRVFQLVKKYGYTTIAFSSEYYDTEIKNADLYIQDIQSKPNNNSIYRLIGRFLGEFQNGVINMTPIPVVLQKFTNYNPFSLHRERTLYTFDQLSKTAKLKRPKFVFVHILIPHPPFVFDSDGRAPHLKGINSMNDGSDLIKKAGMSKEEYQDKYLNQLKFVNQKIKATIEKLLSQSIEAPIIIVQSDHGPCSKLDWEDPDNSNFKERLSILNAYYLPKVNYSNLLNDHITPVNTFRIIFNQYLGTKYKILDDHSYFSTWSHPYKFIEWR